MVFSHLLQEIQSAQVLRLARIKSQIKDHCVRRGRKRVARLFLPICPHHLILSPQRTVHGRGKDVIIVNEEDSWF
jgi:hypothetical protein